MARRAPNNHKPWTPAQVQQLKQLAKGNTPTGVMTIKTGRTKQALYSKASELDISLKPTNQRPYGTRN